jgi:deoxyadenosine/deoxycytidine kinase
MYIAIAGNIGSGKTSLTEILTEHYKATAYFEDSNNPYIGDFYEDMNRWSFNLQVYFLGAKINQQVAMLDTEGDIIQDRTIYEDAHIFASNLHQMGLMSSRDFSTYMNIFKMATNLVPAPDLLIYLRASVPTLISQIRKRGRDYEMSIDEGYLSRLNDKYNDWVDNIYEDEVLTIDIDNTDFVANREAVDAIVAHIDMVRAKLATK